MTPMTFTRLMKSVVLSLAFLIFGHISSAQDVLEISSTNQPLFLTVTFQDPSGNQLRSATINGRGYEWYSVPNGATTFQLRALGIPTAPQTLFKGTNTYVSVSVMSVGQYQVTSQNGITIHGITARSPLQQGKTGYIFVGKLLKSGDDSSEWNSLFLAGAAGKRLYGPNIAPYTYGILKTEAASDNNIFTVDFPLYLRSSIGTTSAVIVRPGQKVKIQSLQEEPAGSGSIYAQVLILP